MSGGILWLASYPKSGNTWLRAFLANYIKNAAEPIPVNDLGLYAPTDVDWSLYERISGMERRDIDDAARARIRPQLHEWLATSSDETVLVKTHNVIGQEGGGFLITPSATAGAIYVVRNPLDVAVSYAHHFSLALDEAIDHTTSTNTIIGLDHPEYAPSFIGDWSGHVRSWLTAPGLRLHVMRYEDMQARPEAVFGQMLRFLQLPEEPARLRRALEFSGFEALKRQEQEAGFQEAPVEGRAFFRSGKTGGWREALTQRQIDAIVNHNTEAMRRLGYLDADGRLTV